MTKSSERAISLIGTNDPESIKKAISMPCACIGAYKGEPLCRCRMLRKEVGERISMFALTRLNKIIPNKQTDVEV